MAEEELEPIDQRIQAALTAGEHMQAYALLAQTYLDTVFRYCCHMLNGDTAQAEEVTQEVFRAACAGIAKFRGESSAKYWLIGIARHLCRRAIASRQRWARIRRKHSGDVRTRVHPEPAQGPEATLLARERLRRLARARDQLEPEEKALVVMRFGLGRRGDFTIADMAEVTGKSRATIYRELQRVLAKLKRLMNDDRG